jgi:murein DD-endopeptidase MepM/ murein hydrolase activator NlpD
MRTCLFLVLVVSSLSVSAQLTDREIRDLKSGRQRDDTSHVYSLPYKTGSSEFFVQGSNSKMSHKSTLAYDFKMKEGTGIYAARSGTVTDFRETSDKGGLAPEMLTEGNYIFIEHDDGSVAAYWHLKKEGVLVNLNDKISAGQLIGLSGNTGYSAFPHLHFQVVDASGKEILVRFQTRKGVLYLKPGNWYRRP